MTNEEVALVQMMKLRGVESTDELIPSDTVVFDLTAEWNRNLEKELGRASTKRELTEWVALQIKIHNIRRATDEEKQRFIAEEHVPSTEY